MLKREDGFGEQFVRWTTEDKRKSFVARVRRWAASRDNLIGCRGRRLQQSEFNHAPGRRMNSESRVNLGGQLRIADLSQGPKMAAEICRFAEGACGKGSHYRQCGGTVIKKLAARHCLVISTAIIALDLACYRNSRCSREDPRQLLIQSQLISDCFNREISDFA